MLEGLRINDAHSLSKASADEIVQKISSAYQLKSAAVTTTLNGVRPFNITQTGYVSGQQHITAATPGRLSNSSQRASSMGTYPAGTPVVHGNNISRAPVMIYTTQPQTDGSFGDAAYSRATIGGYPTTTTGFQPVIASHATSDPYKNWSSSRPLNQLTGLPPYTPSPATTTQFYQPPTISTSNANRNEPTRQTFPNSTYSTQPQPPVNFSNQIRAARPSGQSSNSHYSTHQPFISGQTYPVRPEQVVSGSIQHTSTFDAQTTIRDLTEQLKKERAENATLVNSLASLQRKVNEETQHNQQAVYSEAQEEQEKLGVMRQENDSKLQRVHQEDDGKEEVLRRQIRELEVQVSSLQDNLIEYQKTCDQLTGQIKFNASEQEAGQQVLHGQLSEERKETVKMRDLILEQNILISELKADINKRNFKIEELTRDIGSRGQEIDMYKSLVEETTRKLQRHLEENRNLKQQTQIQEYTTKEIVAQNSLEQTNLAKKIYELESQIRQLSGVSGGDSPTGEDSPLKYPVEGGFGGFHIQATSSSEVEGMYGISKPINVELQTSDHPSSSEIIENLAAFLRSTSTITPNPEKSQLMQSHLNTLANRIATAGQSNLRGFESMNTGKGASSQIQELSQVDSNAGSANTGNGQETANRLITSMAQFLANPAKLREATQEDVDHLAKNVSQISDSMIEIEHDRENIRQQSDKYIEKIALYTQKLDTLEKQNQAMLEKIGNLKIRETELEQRVNTLQESEVIIGKTDRQMSQEVSFEEIQKKLSLSEESEKKLKELLETKKEELKQQNTLIEQLSSGIAEKDKSIVKEMSQDISMLQERLQIAEQERSQIEVREKANTDTYLHQVAELTRKIDESTKQNNAMSPKRIEAETMAQDVEQMNLAASQLKTLVETQTASTDTRNEANQLLTQITTLCIKISATGNLEEKQEAEKVQKHAEMVSQSNFMTDSLNELSQSIADLQSSITNSQLEDSQPIQAVPAYFQSQQTPDQSIIIENLKKSIFELDQSRAGLVQQNSQLRLQNSHLLDRVKEAEENSIRSSHLSHSHAHSHENLSQKQPLDASIQAQDQDQVSSIKAQARPQGQPQGQPQGHIHDQLYAQDSSIQFHAHAQSQALLQDQVDDQLQAQFSFIQSQAHFQTQSQEPFILEPAHAQLHAQSQALESLIQAQAQAQAHLALIAQLSKKVESLQVSANLNRISDHVLRVGVASRSPHPDAQEEMVSGFDNVAKIATSVGSSSRTNPDVAQHLGRIASLAQQMSTKAQSIKAVKGTPINADDEIQLAEIQQLINQVESIHCQSITEEALSVRHLDEAAGHSNEIALLEESINNLEELLEKRDEELQASSSRITFLLGDFSQNQFTSDPPTARFGSFKKAEHKILDLGQGNDGLAQENNQLRSQLTHLHEKIRDMQSDRELQRQQTEVSSKYHGQTIESQGMELGISQISDLSGMPQCIRPSETSEEVERLLDQVAELTDAIAIHERDLQAENDRNSHLQAEIQKMALAIEQLRSETERKDKEIMESKESSSRGIKELKHTVSSHEMDLSTKNEELKLTQKQIDEMNNRLSKAIEELNRARTEKAEIESFASSQISVLKSEVDQLRMELTRSKSLEDNSSHLKSQIDYLSSQLNQSGDIAERERKLAQEIGRLQIERESIEKEKKEIVNLQNQVLDRNESRLRKFSEQGDVDHELQGRVDKLEKDLKDAKEERSRFINKLKEAENAKKIVDIELLETRKQREKIERTWKEKIERLERRCTEFDKDIKTKDSTIDKLDIENGKLHQQLKELKDDLKSSRSELFKLSQSVAPSESPNVNPSQRQSNTSGVVEITGEITNSRIEDSAQQGKEIKKSKQTRRESEGINEESPSKSSQVKIQDEPSTGKKTQSKKDADRKVSNNDAGSWMESEDSEDPSKLFQSYVPPASLIKPVHDVADMRDSKVSDKISSKIENKSEVIKAARDENSRKTDQKSEANKTSRDENASKTDKWSDANRTSRDEYSSKANKKSDTDRTARDEYSVKTQKGEKSSSNVNEVRSPSQTVGDSQVIKKSKTSDSRGQKSKRSGRVRAYEDEYEDVYYIKKIDTIRDVASEYIEKLKQSTKTEERGSKTKREETGEDTDRQEQPNSTPNRFQKEEKKSKKKTTFEPTYVDSEFVAKKKENLIQNVSMEQEEARLHFSVVESQNKNVKDEIKAMSKSQQNPYTSPLLRAEDFEGYDQGDCLIKVSEYAMNNFEVENPERDHVIEEEDEEENEDAAKTERKSTTVGKSSNQPNASGEGKKKKKKKAKSTASGNEPLSQAREWLSLMGMKLT